jgi:hypothetical protein
MSINTRSTALVCLVVALPAIFHAQGTAPPALPTFDQKSFTFLNEFYGARAYTDPAAANNLLSTMANGVTLYQPIDSGLTTFLSTRNARFMFNLFGATKVEGRSASEIEAQRQALVSICQSSGQAVLGWNLMIEWDQAGGHWVPGGRPAFTSLFTVH